MPDTRRVERRLSDLERDGVDRVLVSISSPSGSSRCRARRPSRCSTPMREGVAEPAAMLRRVGSDRARRRRARRTSTGVLDARLRRAIAPRRRAVEPAGLIGCAGARPAGASRTRRCSYTPGPAWRLCAARSGRPRPGGRRSRGTSFDMQAAWLSFLAAGRPAHPELKVVFAMLAGCAPLQRERLAARGGPAYRAVDPLMFYDCSSYGTRSLDAMIRCVGVEQIVYGSDRPVVEPRAARLGEAARPCDAGRQPGARAERSGWWRRDRLSPPGVTWTAPSCASWCRRSPRGRTCGGTSSATSTAQRVYEQLWRDDHVAAWVICWTHDQDTGFHDHDLSAGAVAVAERQVREERLVLGGAPIAAHVRPAATFDFSASDIHRVLHPATSPRSRCTRTRHRCGAWARTRCSRRAPGPPLRLLRRGAATRS